MRKTFGDIGTTVSDLLGAPDTGLGTSFKGGDSVMFNMNDIIYKKREGELSREEIHFLLRIMSRGAHSGLSGSSTF